MWNAVAMNIVASLAESFDFYRQQVGPLADVDKNVARARYQVAVQSVHAAHEEVNEVIRVIGNGFQLGMDV